MTRLETLEKRYERLQSVKEDYTSSEKIGGKIYRNKKAVRFIDVCMRIKKEIRTIKNQEI